MGASIPLLPSGDAAGLWAEPRLSRERRGPAGDLQGLLSAPHSAFFYYFFFLLGDWGSKQPPPSLWMRNPPGDLQREAARSHLRHGVGWRGKAAGERPTTIKCDKCHICKSCGNDLKLSGTAQLSIILKLLLLPGQISISSLSLFWQDLDYLMPRRCILSPHRSWGVRLLRSRVQPQASERAFLGALKP